MELGCALAEGDRPAAICPVTEPPAGLLIATIVASDKTRAGTATKVAARIEMFIILPSNGNQVGSAPD
jgi:hypothetical protein